MTNAYRNTRYLQSTSLYARLEMCGGATIEYNIELARPNKDLHGRLAYKLNTEPCVLYVGGSFNMY